MTYIQNKLKILCKIKPTISSKRRITTSSKRISTTLHRKFRILNLRSTTPMKRYTPIMAYVRKRMSSVESQFLLTESLP